MPSKNKIHNNAARKNASHPDSQRNQGGISMNIEPEVADQEALTRGKESGNINSSLSSVATIEDLRQLEPACSGQMVIVKEYFAGTNTGGGIFIYDENDKETPDDYGVTIVTPQGARWKRDVDDIRNLTALDFGAVDGGVIDAVGAVRYMWNWSQKYNANIGIQFPAGKFLISHFDISDKGVSHFRLSGDFVTFGYSPTTTLISDKKNDEVMFNVNARHTEITSLLVNGESCDKTRNTKGFYKNSMQAGQFVRINNIMFNNMGGKGISLLDTLDCKIDQWYASYCSESVIYATWSNSTQGKWDHITAIELSNFNIQHNTEKPAIDLQRATQSLIWNGWIEHTEFPGNLSNGGWSFRGLSIEDCANPMECHYARIINSQFNVHGDHGLDFSETGDTWKELSLYEQGDVHIENHGIEIHGSLTYDYLSTHDKMDNRTKDEKWFYVGEITPSMKTVQTKIRIIGSAAYNSQKETQKGYSFRTPEGSADIYVQKINDTSYVGSWAGQGSVPLTRVLLQPGSNDYSIRVYVKVAAYTGYCTAFIETNDYNRFSHGERFIFKKSYTEVTDKNELITLNGTPDNCFHQHWCGNSSVGIGFNNDNALLLQGAEIDSRNVVDWSSSKYIKVLIDGRVLALELKYTNLPNERS